MSKVEIVPVYLGGGVTSKETKRGETVFTFTPAPLARFYQIRKDGRVVDTALTKPVAERRAMALQKQTGGGKRSMTRRAYLLQQSAVRSHVAADSESSPPETSLYLTAGDEESSAVLSGASLTPFGSGSCLRSRPRSGLAADALRSLAQFIIPGESNA